LTSVSVIAAGTPLSEKVRATVGIFISLAGLTCGLTILFLGMRAVMDIGGYCAEGGPFEIRQTCPDGVPGLFLGGLWGGIIFCGIYVWQTIKHEVPSFLALVWPALFLSLGWNFWEYGLNPPAPPGEEAGIVWSWIICGVVFFLMGGLPLIAAIPAVIKSFTKDDEEPPGFKSIVTEPLSVLRNIKVRPTTPPTEDRPDPFKRQDPSTSGASDDLVGELERLAALHRSGALGDSEYAAAKRRLLEDG
jgi:hypothetical protein